MGFHGNSKFKGAYCKELIEEFSKGKSKTEFMADRNITEKAFRSWCNNYPSFKEAYKLAKVKGQAYWWGKFKANLCNTSFNSKDVKYILTNHYGVTEKPAMYFDWLDSGNVMQSLSNLINLFNEEGATVHDLRSGIAVLLDISDLKERSELEDRVQELEKNLNKQLYEQTATDEPYQED